MIGVLYLLEVVLIVELNFDFGDMIPLFSVVATFCWYFGFPVCVVHVIVLNIILVGDR